MTYRNESADAQMEKALRDGRGDEIITLRQQFESTIGMHKMPERLEFLAMTLGLKTSLVTAGGWFVKEHQLTVEGPLKKVKAWQEAARQAAQ